jgi:hypothetical protein
MIPTMLRLAALIAASALASGCCHHLTVENASDTPVEVTAWVPTGSGPIFDTVDVYQNDLAPGVVWRAACEERVNEGPRPRAPEVIGLRVRAVRAGGGRVWLVAVKREQPWTLRVQGSGGALEFRSMARNGVMWTEDGLDVREQAGGT